MTKLATLRIIHYPDPRLKKPCGPVTTFDGRLAGLARRMFELMYEACGIGLAAPQVGILRQLFVCNPTGEPEDQMAFVNPRLVLKGNEVVNEEGCLSVPDVYADLARASRVLLRAQDLTGRQVKIDADDLLARCFQHELDHLNGILIADRMSDSACLANRRALRHLENTLRARR